MSQETQDRANQLIAGFDAASPDSPSNTWDLARAVGGDEQLPEQAVAGAYSGLRPMDAMLRRPGWFDARIDVTEGTDIQTEFLSFLGRKV